MIFILTNSNNQLEYFIHRFNTSHAGNLDHMLTIGKTIHDDIFNLLFMEEKLQEKILLITIQPKNKDCQNLFSLSKNSKLLINKLLFESECIANGHENFLLNSLNRFFVRQLIFIKSLNLRKKLENHFTRQNQL